MPFTVIAAGLAIEVGATMVVKGLEITLPEIAKIAQAPEIGRLATAIDKNTIIKSAASTVRKLRVQ